MKSKRIVRNETSHMSKEAEASQNALLDETLQLMKSKNVDLKKFKGNEFFERVGINLKVLKVLKNKKTFLQKIIFYWDIILLSLLILVFSIYLGFFLNVYFSKDPNTHSEFYSQVSSVYKWFIQKWLALSKSDDLIKEECVVYSPDFSNSVTRPIDDCSMCEHKKLFRIDRISNISKEEFAEKYAYTGVPVIVTDAISDWSALHLFNFKFLKDLYLNVNRSSEHGPANVKLAQLNELTLFKKLNQMVGHSERGGKYEKLTCQFFPYKTKFRSLRQVFDKVERNYDEETNEWVKPWYVGWSNCNDHVSKVLKKHYARPYFLPDESEMSKLDWIFMGTPGYGADMHIDDVSNPSWQAQISGIKHWVFKPPAECLHKCPWTLTADVYPGDIIVFDSNRWFHSTRIIGKQLSLTIGSEYD
jgi:histone arginine demethylase JMJD6